jgi:hypothetical protein
LSPGYARASSRSLSARSPKHLPAKHGFTRTRSSEHARWLAFIDIDEFLFSPERDSLAKILPEYERYPGVVANWQVYGSSGLARKPPGLVIESYLTRARTDWARNQRVKSIIDPTRASAPQGPHFFEYHDGALAVTENHQPVRVIKSHTSVRRLRRALLQLPLAQTDPYAIRDPYAARHSSVKEVSVRRLRINHYAVKSREEYAEKVARHTPPEGSNPASRIAPLYFAYHDRNEFHDALLIRYAHQVRSRLERTG